MLEIESCVREIGNAAEVSILRKSYQEEIGVVKIYIIDFSGLFRFYVWIALCKGVLVIQIKEIKRRSDLGVYVANSCDTFNSILSDTFYQEIESNPTG